MQPCFENLPPEQQISVKDCRRDAPGWQEEGQEGKHCQVSNHLLLLKMCWCSQGRQAGAGPCGCPAFCAALPGSATEVISGISPLCH